MWQSLFGIGLGLVSLGMTVSWLVVDEWLHFRDDSGYMPGEGHSGLWHECKQDICRPIPPGLGVFWDAPRGLAITSVSILTFYLLSGLTCLPCMPTDNRWQYLYRPFGVALCLGGLFSCSAGAVCLMHFNELGLMGSSSAFYREVTIEPGWCSLLAIIGGILEMLGGLTMFQMAHEMTHTYYARSAVPRVNNLIAEVQAQHRVEHIQGQTIRAEVQVQNRVEHIQGRNIPAEVQAQHRVEHIQRQTIPAEASAPPLYESLYRNPPPAYDQLSDLAHQAPSIISNCQR